MARGSGIQRKNILTFMRWLKTHLKDYFQALMGSGKASLSRQEGLTEDIRQLILDELGELGEKNHPKTVLRVRYAQDAQALWYVRGDLMVALADRHGETIAREKVAHISDMFKGLLPRGLSSRPSTLTH